MRRFLKICVALAGLGLFTGAAHAQETTTYTYDAKGRVITTTRSGGPSNGVNATYTYDKADNRTNVTVAGSPNGSGGPGSDGGASTSTTIYIVVPLNGFTIIPIG